MQQLNLNKPDFKYLDYFIDLLSLDKLDKELHIVYDMKFIKPSIGLLIASFVNNSGFSVTHEVTENGKNSLGYAKNFNFFHYMEEPTNFEARNTSYSGTYTPIICSHLDSYYRGGDNIVENITGRIVEVLSAGDENLKPMLNYIIFEMFRNIPEHSQCFKGWHCSQRWEHQDYIETEIAIIDYGIGFKESLNFKGKFNIESDIEALEAALTPGITGGITDRSHLRENEEQDYLNSGYGLYAITELCKRLGGNFLIVSKGAYAKNKKLKTEIQSLGGGLIFPGTAIKLKLRIKKNLTREEFNNIRNEIVQSGETKSMNIPGTIQKASNKSRGI